MRGKAFFTVFSGYIPYILSALGFVFLSFPVGGCGTSATPPAFESSWPDDLERIWPGPEYWSNPLQDWQVSAGRLECVKAAPNRSVHLLTRALEGKDGDFSMAVTVGFPKVADPPPLQGWAGFRVAARGEFGDYRDDALYGKGIDAGIRAGDTLFIRTPAGQEKSAPAGKIASLAGEGIELRLTGTPEKGGVNHSLALKAVNPLKGEVIAEVVLAAVPSFTLEGSLALVSSFSPPRGEQRHRGAWFSRWRAGGSKTVAREERAFGPLLFASYTLSRGTLKLSAQLVPVGKRDSQTVTLEIADGSGSWQSKGEAPIDEDSRTALFQVNRWDASRDTAYRLSHQLYDGEGQTKTYYLDGTIRREPVEKEEIVVAAFTGNNDLGFPNSDLVKAVDAQDPDLLFFSGDQIYERVGGFGHKRGPLEEATLDYLRKWYLFGWAWGELFRDRPMISIPDDHDVYHGNIWGEGGRAASTKGSRIERQDGGGYLMPPRWVNMVQRTQTSHLPDPVDPAAAAHEINVYFTSLDYGGVSFAILEDRKFKSAPRTRLPEADIVNGWAQNPGFDPARDGGDPDAVLLGESQLRFIDSWAADWSGGAWMKVVLSQTLFSAVATLPSGAVTGAVIPRLPILSPGEYPPDDRPAADMDTNGWPQPGRNRAIKAMRKGFAFHVAGDQHLGSFIRYGVDEWGDGGFAFSVPSISNFWPRRWFPSTPGGSRLEGAPGYTGNFIDGLGNRMTVYAVSNPSVTGKKPAKLYDRAAGYGVLRFNRTTREITAECWQRGQDPSQGGSIQYRGWPITVAQVDGNRRSSSAWLPPVEVTGLIDPVIQVLQENDGEMLYTLRVKGRTFQAEVFSPGKYTLKIGDPDGAVWKSLPGLEAGEKVAEAIQITF